MNSPAFIQFVAEWGRLIAGAGTVAILLFAVLVARRARRRWLRVGALSLSGVGVLCGVLGFAVLTRLAPVLDLTIGRHPAVGQRLAVSFNEVAEDTPRTLEAYAGKVVLLNWWATWCEPCRRELPALERVSAELGGAGLVVLMLSDEEREVLLAPPAAGSGPLRGYVDFDVLPELMRGIARVRPVNIFIDRQGVVRGVFVGERDEAFFEEQARKYL